MTFQRGVGRFSESVNTVADVAEKAVSEVVNPPPSPRCLHFYSCIHFSLPYGLHVILFDISEGGSVPRKTVCVCARAFIRRLQSDAVKLIRSATSRAVLSTDFDVKVLLV